MRKWLSLRKVRSMPLKKNVKGCIMKVLGLKKLKKRYILKKKRLIRN
jgi:hypothetical protein